MKRLLTAAVAAAALWAAACSPGHPAITPPPPSGNYGLASLNGTYAFVTSGEVITSGGTSATPFSRTGSFTANGRGGITGGVYDVVNAGGSSTVSSSPIAIMSGSSYTVNADGRGTLTFNVNSGGVPSTVNFGLVLTTAMACPGPPCTVTDGLMMDETASANQASTGSGNFVLQTTSTFATGVSGSYVFDFSGLDGNQPSAPESLVGQFVASGGVITSGIEDANDNFTLTNGAISGNFAPDPANSATSGRGTATVAGQTYAFYIVDSTRIRFVSINANGVGPMLVGDAVSQPSVPPAPSGSFAFLVAGSSANGGLTRVARFDTCAPCAGPGPAVSKLLMDVNNAGSEIEFGPSALTNASLNYDSTTGRGVVSFQSSTTNVYSFVFYLSSATSGVTQEVSPNDTSPAFAVADGTIAAQSGSPFTSSNITGPYALNWSGLVTSGGQFANQDEEDLLAQETIKSLNLSGTYDLFQFTGVTLGTDLGSTGAINFNGGDGTGGDGKSATMNFSLSNASPVHLVVYFVNPQLAFFANRDNNGAQRIVAGILKAQQ
jgi:hypothetical protein